MRRWLDFDHLLLLALLLLHVVPLWFFTYFPSQDGPTHLENAVILREYRDRPVLQEFYEPNLSPDPNWLGHLILAGLMTILPLLIAEKVLLTGYLLLLPISVYYALNGIRPGAGWLTVLIFPFVQHFLYHMGFHNFCYSLAVFFLVIGYWVRVQDRFGLRQLAVLAGLILLLYFCHLVAVVMALMAVGGLGLLGTLIEWRTVPAEKRWGVLLHRLVLPMAAFVPTVALGFAFVGRQGTGSAWAYSAAELFKRLRQIEVLVSYRVPLPGPIYLEPLLVQSVFWELMILAVVVLLTRVRRRLWNRGDGVLALVVLATIAYFTAPSTLSGGQFVNTRLSLFPFFFLILWLSVHSFGTGTKRILQVTGTLLVLGLLGLHIIAYASFNEYLKEYVSVAPQLEADRTLLPMPFSRELQTENGRLAASKIGVFRHAAGYLAAERGVIDLENYEATTRYFPFKYREEINPYRRLGLGEGADRGLQAEPPEVDIVAYEKNTGKRVDYVLVWNVLPEQRDTPAGKKIFEQIDRGYELTYTSPRQLLRLYRRKSEP
jgi:hypothetical protein